MDMVVGGFIKPLQASAAPNKQPKLWWPELVGVAATAAVTQIAHDRPDVAVEVLPPGTPHAVPGEEGVMNLKRVRVFINDLGAVAQIPYVG